MQSNFLFGARTMKRSAKAGNQISQKYAEIEKGNQGFAPKFGDGDGVRSKSATEPSLDDAAIAELVYLIEEEKLAGDIYEAFYAQTGMKVFDRIAESEDRHMDALVAQAVAAGVDVSELLLFPEGVYRDDALQALYDDLLARGSQSPTAALEVGVLIETTDIVDLEEARDGVEGTRLASVYDALLEGSVNHLAAFEGLLG